MTIIGDGGMEEGIVYETLNLASFHFQLFLSVKIIDILFIQILKEEQNLKIFQKKLNLLILNI